MLFANSIISLKSESFSLPSISAASFLIVGSLNNRDISKLTPICEYIIELNFISVNDVNPIAYKSSVTPNWSVLMSSTAISKSFSSVSFSGLPEFRERVILVGTRCKNSFEYPLPTHGEKEGLKPYVTLEDALSDLPCMQSGEENKNYLSNPQNDFQKFVHDCEELKDNLSPKNGEHLIKLMKALPDGGTKDDLPEDLKPKSGFGNTYAKMWWKRPAPTITRNFACPSSSRCIHPRDSRALSTREGARLQSFPDSYKFYGSTGMKNLQIGNAVPPLLSVALAKQVEKFFEEKK